MKIVVEENDNKRIDKYLSEKVSFSRSLIEKMIKNGNILVNNKLLLQELIYDYNDETIIIQNNKIIYKTPKDKRNLIEYEDFDDLIFL